MRNHVELDSIVLEKMIYKNALPLFFFLFFFYSYRVFSALNANLPFISAIYICLSIMMLFCQIWLKLPKRIWRRSLKCKQFTDWRRDRRTDRRTTDKMWSENLTWAFSSGELKTDPDQNYFKMEFLQNTMYSLFWVVDMNCIVN